MSKLYQTGDIVKVKKLTESDLAFHGQIEYSEKEITLKNFYREDNWNTSLKNDYVFHDEWIDYIVKRVDGKYKVGDKVKVNQDIEPQERKYKNKPQRFTITKKNLKTITIKEVIKRDDVLSINYNYMYKDTGDNLFTDWMLDGLCEEEKENNYLKIAKQLRVPNNKEELEKYKKTASLLERGYTCENILCANCIFNASIKCYKENKQKRAEILKEYVNLYKDYFKESVKDKQELVFTEEYYEQAKQLLYGNSIWDSMLEGQKLVDVNIKKLSESKLYENKEDDFILSNKPKLKFDEDKLSSKFVDSIFSCKAPPSFEEWLSNLTFDTDDDFKLSTKHKLKF